MNRSTNAAPAETVLPETQVEVLRVALDDLDEMQAALDGVCDLLVPSRPNDDLSFVNRGNLTTLMTVLLRQHAAVLARAHRGFVVLRESPAFCEAEQEAEIVAVAAKIFANAKGPGTEGTILDPEKPE